MSKISYYHAEVSRKSQNQQKQVIKMGVTFDLNKIFQFCFDILKEK